MSIDLENQNQDVLLGFRAMFIFVEHFQKILGIAFDRRDIIYVVLNHSHGFYNVLWELIMDASLRSFQGLTAILDYVTHVASMSCWY